MRYGKIRIEDNNLIFVKHMMTNSLPCQDILWAYRRREDGKEIASGQGSGGNSVIIRTRKGKRYKFDMTEEETRACLNHLKEINPNMAKGFPKGARIPLQSMPNTRDLGALKTWNGKYILPGKLIRSGELYHLSKADIQTLREDYQLSTVVDFRTEAERLRKPDTEMEGVCYIENSILEESTVGITREEGIDDMMLGFEGDADAYMEKIYRNLVTDRYAANHYAKFFQYLLDQENGAILWHCTAGKDRAGIATVLLLSALGMSKDVIMEDYLKTNQYARQETEYMLQLLSSRLDRYPQGEKNIRIMMSVKESYLQSAYNAIEEECGSVERYLKKRMCLTSKAIEKLQNKYLI